LQWHTDGVIPYQLWADVLAKFPNIISKPVADGFTRMRMALGSEELAVVRHAAAIGDEMAKAMVAVARPGALDSEIFAAGMAAAHSRGTVVPAIMMIFPANKGPGPPAWAYRPQPPQAVKNGDVIVAEMFSNFSIRETQHQLTIVVGEVHEDIERAARLTRACYDAGLHALRPGVIFDDICKAMLKPVEDAESWSRGPQIHSLNPIAAVCAVPPNMGHFTRMEYYPPMPPYPIMGGDLTIEAGMTFAFEPNCGFGQNMVCLGATVIIGEDGAIE
jgi:Xaa-Pro aminopeptidase